MNLPGLCHTSVKEDIGLRSNTIKITQLYICKLMGFLRNLFCCLCYSFATYKSFLKKYVKVAEKFVCVLNALMLPFPEKNNESVEMTSYVNVTLIRHSMKHLLINLSKTKVVFFCTIQSKAKILLIIKI